MKFRVLGPLEAERAQGVVDLGGPKQRLVLALLLSNPGRLTSTDRLIDGIWGESPPAAARNSLQSYVSNLRKALGSAELIEGRKGGYVLVVAEHDIDANVFVHLVEESRRELEWDAEAAVARLHEALALWRGEPYEDLLHEHALQFEIRHLNETRLRAIELRVDAQLGTGSSVELIAELESLTSQYPMRERLWGQLMEALYRSGRQAEALRAYQRAKSTLAEELGIEPGPELQRLENRVLQQDPTLLGRKAQRSNPYKGLYSFTEADAAIFHGRRDFTHRLLERFSERGLRGRLIVLTGPSGGGKTSVVRAGLIPALRSGVLPGSNDWEIITTFPGSEPFRQLSEAIQGLEPSTGRAPSASPVHRLRETHRLTLVFVDQFEEVWTHVEDTAARRGYIDDLIDLTRQSTHVRVVLAVRADFLDRLVVDEAVASILEEVLVVLPPLTDTELTEAVVEPARAARVPLAPDLVAQIVRDARGRPGALPLLQFAMTELFERWESDPISAATYEAIGGIAGALSKRADELFQAFPDPARVATRDIFLRLAAITDEGEISKRRATRKEVSGLSSQDEAVDRVIDEFGRHRFLVFDRDPEGQPTIEIAHESLFREWARLRGWIDARIDDLRTQHRLRSAVADWNDSNEDESYLLSGHRLAEIERWAETTDLKLTEAEASFLTASRDVRDAKRRRSTRLRWAIIAALGIAALVAGFLALFASIQRSRAQEARDRANAERLTAAASAQITEDPQLALLLAVEASEAFIRLDDAGSGALMDSLHDAIGANRALATLNAGGFVSYSPYGDRIVAVADISGAGTTIDEGAEIGVFDADTGRRLITLPMEGRSIGDLTYGGSPPMIAATFLEGVVTVWDEPGSVIAEWAVPDGVPDNPTFSSAGHFSINVVDPESGQWLHTVVYDTSDWSERFRIPIDRVNTVAFDAEGRTLAITQGGRGVVQLVDTATGEIIGELPHGPLAIGSSFDPRGGRIATISVEPPAVLKIWDLESFEVSASTTIQTTVLSIAWSPNGESIATAGPDGVITLWDPGTATELLTLRGHKGGLNVPRSSVSFHPSGDRLASADLESTIIWRVAPGPGPEVVAITAHDATDPSEDASFTDDTTVVSSSAASLAWVDVDSGRTTRRVTTVGDPTIEFFVVGPNGRLVARYDSGGKSPPEMVAAETGVVLVVLDGGGNPVAFDDSAEMLVVSGATPGDAGAVYDTATGLEIMSLPIDAPDQSIEVADFDSRRRLLAVGYSSGVVVLWDLESQKRLGDLDHLGFPTSIEFNAQGDLLATADISGAINVWDAAAIASGAPQESSLIRDVGFPAGHALAVGFTPGGDLFASGFTKRVTVWDLATGAERYDIETGAPGWSVDLSPDGIRMVVPGAEGTIRIYTMSPEELVDIARSRLLRGFSAEECARFQVEPCRSLDEMTR